MFLRLCQYSLRSNLPGPSSQAQVISSTAMLVARIGYKPINIIEGSVIQLKYDNRSTEQEKCRSQRYRCPQFPSGEPMKLNWQLQVELGFYYQPDGY